MTVQSAKERNRLFTSRLCGDIKRGSDRPADRGLREGFDTGFEASVRTAGSFQVSQSVPSFRGPDSGGSR